MTVVCAIDWRVKFGLLDPMKCLLVLVLSIVHLAVFAGSNIEVYFSPNGGCTEAVTNALAKTKQSILVQAYSFTSAPIAKAIVDAHKRGVKVTVILDKSQRTEKYSSADFLNNSGVATFIDAKHAIAHNKIMILDEATVITGSFNFTKAAELVNAENLLIIEDKELASKYAHNWNDHLKHSEPYKSKSAKRVPQLSMLK